MQKDTKISQSNHSNHSIVLNIIDIVVQIDKTFFDTWAANKNLASNVHESNEVVG